MTTDAPARGHGRIWLMITLGLILVAVAGVLLLHNQPPPTNAGALPSPAASTPQHSAVTTSAPASAAAGSPPTSTARASKSQHPAVAAEPTVVTQQPAAPAAPLTGHPAVLHLPTLKVTARVDPVDSDHGVLQVPDDISRVGWWKQSADPGSAAGSTVIDGHIDSAVAGEGALFHLGDLGPGDPVTLTTSTGATIYYRVQARRVYVKQQGLPAELFNQQGPGRLIIISCGGPFDRSIRSYEDNIAIFATATTT